MSNSIHSVRESFQLDSYLDARRKTIELLEEVALEIKSGMTEAEGITLINNKFEKFNVSNKWHPTKLRYGVNTLKSFKEPSALDIILGDDDHFFIDIGTVFDGYEGDFGRTFVLGEDINKKRIKDASEEIFYLSQDYWRKNKATGIELYNYAEALATKMNYQLSRNMDGHRLGDFPHQVFYRGGLAECNESPVANLWVLEIHLLDLENKMGAFFEDVLVL